MNATDLTTLSISELRDMCTSHSIEVVGDRRAKLTFINAIEMQNQRSVAAEATMTIGLSAEATMTIGQSEPDPSLDLPLTEAAAVMAECHSTLLDLYIDSTVTASTAQVAESIAQQPAPQQQPTHQKHSASIVIIIPLVLLTVAVILIKIGISAIISIIGSLIGFTGSIWQSVSDTDRGIESIPIDYPPAAAA